jgi:hypothetical protein
MLSGDNGVLQRATDAKTNTDNAQIKERIQLAYLSGLSGGNGSIDKGSFLLELQKEFGADKVTEDNIVESEDGKKWTVTIDGATVELEAGSTIAQNPQEPEIPSLPKNTGTKPYLPSSVFHQLPGTNLSDGLVITDAADPEDTSNPGNEYVWIEVPSTAVDSTATGGPDYTGVAGATDYTNISAALKNYCAKDANGGDLITSSYTDIWDDGCGISSSEDYDNLYHIMLKSVYENGGFWIGRYEAGTGTARNNGDSASGITPLSKIDLYPINYVTCGEAQTIATNVPNKGSYNSSLMFGIQWDLVLRHLSNKGVDTSLLTGTSESWGNYDLAYDLNQSTAHGFKLGYQYKVMGDSTIIPWSTIESGFTHPKTVVITPGNSSGVPAYAFSSGATTRNMQKNIYDLAGNMEEYTLETDGTSPIARGGLCMSGYNLVTTRHIQSGSYYFGSFRVCIY